MSKISQAVDYMKDIANDSKHGYSQTNRWGSPDTWSDYDCSSLVISAWQEAGVPVRIKAQHIQAICTTLLSNAALRT